MKTECSLATEKELAYNSLRLASRNEKEFVLARRIFDVLSDLRDSEMALSIAENRSYNLHGLGLVLGFSQEDHKNSFNFSVGKDLFCGRRFDNDHVLGSDAATHLASAMKHDGVILVDTNGFLLHSGRYINVNTLGILAESPLAREGYGNMRMNNVEAGTRHLSCIAASCLIPELFFFTLKSDKPHIRVFKGGHIIHSTLANEVNFAHAISPECAPKQEEERQAAIA